VICQSISCWCTSGNQYIHIFSGRSWCEPENITTLFWLFRPIIWFAERFEVPSTNTENVFSQGLSDCFGATIPAAMQ
jgi:hypothetical protein